jgi:hypothetical protein
MLSYLREIKYIFLKKILVQRLFQTNRYFKLISETMKTNEKNNFKS